MIDHYMKFKMNIKNIITTNYTCLFLLLITAVFTSCAQSNEVRDSDKLIYKIIEEGVGEVAKVGDEVSINETMRYSDETLLFSTNQLGHPIKFLLGGNQVIKGLDEGIKGMKKGEKRKLIIPPSLSKRSEYPSHVHPDSTLYYEVELVDILKPNKVMAPQSVDPEVVYLTKDRGKTWSPFANGIPKDATISGLKLFKTVFMQLPMNTEFLLLKMVIIIGNR